MTTEFKQWVLRKYPWMDDDQFECYQMLCDLFSGAHHVHGKLHEWGSGIRLNTSQTGAFCTFDFSRLTFAVLMAHDRCIRFGIEPSGPGMLGLTLYKRHSREGGMSERHPTIVQALEVYRKSYPEPDSA